LTFTVLKIVNVYARIKLMNQNENITEGIKKKAIESATFEMYE